MPLPWVETDHGYEHAPDCEGGSPCSCGLDQGPPAPRQWAIWCCTNSEGCGYYSTCDGVPFAGARLPEGASSFTEKGVSVPCPCCGEGRLIRQPVVGAPRVRYA